MTEARQGDVYVQPLPANIMKKYAKFLKASKRDARGRYVLAEGEVTGHAHALHGDDNVLMRGEDVIKELANDLVKAGIITDATGVDAFFSIGEGGDNLVHEEHSTIHLNEGGYVNLRQREYSPEALKFVAD